MEAINLGANKRQEGMGQDCSLIVLTSAAKGTTEADTGEDVLTACSDVPALHSVQH